MKETNVICSQSALAKCDVMSELSGGTLKFIM